jgi:SET domain-containing protein
VSSPFFVRRSAIHGRGVFTRKALAARRKFGVLTGERISVREARRRAARSPIVTIVEFEDGTALDVSGGNEFRFVNHSCAPNVFLRRAHGRVEFYALRDVKPGEELTCDYGESHHNGKLPCRCGAETCAGRL